MARRLRVGILFGGRSGEHEVSLRSAASILKAIDRRRFEVVPIGITREGRWVADGDARSLLEGGLPERRALGEQDRGATRRLLRQGIPELVGPEPAATGLTRPANGGGRSLDVVFPVLHGTFGEDGTIQGLFELADIPYVGSGVLGSAAGMDKDVMKRLFAQAGLPIVRHVTVLRREWERSPRRAIAAVEESLSYPVFVKPANLGSSVGISKAHDRRELGPALDLAAQYDRKLVVEQGVGGRRTRARELEVGVLGNEDAKASVVGEIIPGGEFYDYEAKYLSEGSVPVIPARLTRDESGRIRAMALEAFHACDLAGLARVDFLMESGGRRRIYVNEVNTLPGFTEISMYSKLWEATGLSYRDLISRLIELALERQREKSRTRYSRQE